MICFLWWPFQLDVSIFPLSDALCLLICTDCWYSFQIYGNIIQRAKKKNLCMSPSFPSIIQADQNPVWNWTHVISRRQARLPPTKPTTCVHAFYNVRPFTEFISHSLNFKNELQSLNLRDISLGSNDTCVHCATAERADCSRCRCIISAGSHSHIARREKASLQAFSQRTECLHGWLREKKFVKAGSPLATHRTDDGGQLLVDPRVNRKSSAVPAGLRAAVTNATGPRPI